MFGQSLAAGDAESWSDEQYDAWVAELIAGDPGEPDGLWDGTVVARDPVTDAVQAARMRNLADARIALAVADLLRTTSPRECISARTLVAAEIGPALSLGSGAATKLVDTVIALTTRLPATFDAVCDGALAWDKAVALAQWTSALTDEQAGAVEDRVRQRRRSRGCRRTPTSGEGRRRLDPLAPRRRHGRAVRTHGVRTARHRLDRCRSVGALA